MTAFEIINMVLNKSKPKERNANYNEVKVFFERVLHKTECLKCDLKKWNTPQCGECGVKK